MRKSHPRLREDLAGRTKKAIFTRSPIPEARLAIETINQPPTSPRIKSTSDIGLDTRVFYTNRFDIFGPNDDDTFDDPVRPGIVDQPAKSRRRG